MNGGWIDGWTNGGWIYRWVDGRWKYGFMDEWWVDGQTEVGLSPHQAKPKLVFILQYKGNWAGECQVRLRWAFTYQKDK